MVNVKLMLPLVLTIATSLTGVSVATNTETDETDIRSEISVQQEEKLSEKLEAGEITQEQYDKIITAIESGEFHGAWGHNAKRGKRECATELTEEQKAELSAKRDEMLSEKLESGEITQEQYDEIIAATESGEFRGAWGHNAMGGKRECATELTEEQKAELSAKRDEMLSKKLEAGEITEKQAEGMRNGDFGGFRGGMRGNFGSRNH